MTASADCAACLKSVPQRYIIASMIFWAIVGLMMMRSCMSLTLTQMVVPTVSTTIAHVDETACPARIVVERQHNVSLANVEPSAVDGEKFEWSQKLQGMILSSFYVGYVIMHVPGGILAERIGGKPVIVAGLLLSAIISASLPIIVNTGGAPALIVLRVVLGCVQAGFFPAVATMLAKWVPTTERGRIGSLVFCGIPFGAIVGNFAAGVLMHVAETWHAVFYICAVVGCALALLFTLICTNCPSTHPFISDEEKRFLRKHIRQARCRDEKPMATPWKAILTSGPVLALIVAEAFGSWAYFVASLDLPLYMNDVLHVSIQENGIYSSLPWLVYVFVSFVSGYVSDWIITTKRLTITNTRKFLVILSSTINGVFILVAAYAGCDPMLVGASVAVAVGANGLETSSIMINSLDLSPNFAGMITGIIGTIACIMGVAVPIVVSFMTPNSLQSEWRFVFWITFFMLIGKLTVYTIWGSGEVQPWNEPEPRKDVATVELMGKHSKSVRVPERTMDKK